MLNVVIVLVLAVIMYIYLRYSKQGYEIAVVGEIRAHGALYRPTC